MRLIKISYAIKKHGVNSFYEEVYWDDLNQWLTDNEKRISWRFVNPVCDKHEIQVNKPTKAHTIKNRTNILDAEINFAKKNALDKNDPSSVWAELIKNAENKDLKVKGCLIGIDEKSIKYLDGDEVKFFTKKNLSGRMNRK